MKGSPLSKGDAEGSQPRSQHSAAPSKSSQPSAGANKASQPGTGDAGQPHSQRSASQAKQAKQSQQSVADEDKDNSFDFGSDCSSVKSADFDIEDPMQSFGLSSREREAIEIGIQATAARLADEGTASGGGGTLLLKEGAVLEVQLPLHPLSPLQRTTLDLAEDAHLVLISLDVQGGWTSSAVPPTSIVRLVSTTSSTIISHSDEHTSATPLGLLLYAGVRAIAKKMWGEPEYLYELSTSTLRLLCNAGDYCFCCAERLNVRARGEVGFRRRLTKHLRSSAASSRRYATARCASTSWMVRPDGASPPRQALICHTHRSRPRRLALRATRRAHCRLSHCHRPRRSRRRRQSTVDASRAAFFARRLAVDCKVAAHDHRGSTAGRSHGGPVAYRTQGADWSRGVCDAQVDLHLESRASGCAGAA
jgi:hypothetical protein